MHDLNIVHDDLLRYYGAEPDYHGEVWTQCPFCGHDSRGKRGFSFSHNAFKCFSCGVGGSIVQLAEKIGLDLSGARLDDRRDHVRAIVTPPPAPVKPPPPWQAQAVTLLSAYQRHPDREALWQVYKPITRTTLRKHHFGVGKLPFEGRSGWYESKDDLLIVPLFQDGVLMGIRGRQSAGGWLSASGTRYCLWNVENLRPGGTVWITENYVDAALLMQEYPRYQAVAIGGAGNWNTDWQERLAAKRPRCIIVATDNDLAGQATGAFRQQLLAAWREKHPGLPDPPSGGLRIYKHLQDARLPVELWRWPDDAPARYDIGQYILDGRKLP